MEEVTQELLPKAMFIVLLNTIKVNTAIAKETTLMAWKDFGGI